MKQKISPGITLVELLASFSVLLVLLTLMSQTIGMVSSTCRSGLARIDAFTQARTTLGLLDRDLQRIVLRPELAAFTDQTGTAGALAFYTRVQGGTGDRSVSLVEYLVQNPTARPQLVRCDYGLNFEPAASSRAPSYGKTNLPDLANAEARNLAPGVVRMGWKFVDGNGAEQDRFTFDYARPQSPTNTRLLRTSLLVLDSNAAELLVDSGKLSTLLTETGATPEEEETLGASWERLLESGTLTTRLPVPVVKSLKVFERTFTIPTNR